MFNDSCNTISGEQALQMSFPQIIFYRKHDDDDALREEISTRAKDRSDSMISLCCISVSPFFDRREHFKKLLLQKIMRVSVFRSWKKWVHFGIDSYAYILMHRKK